MALLTFFFAAAIIFATFYGINYAIDALTWTPEAKYECRPRSSGFGSIVCVCDGTFCGSLVSKKPPAGVFHWYASDKAGKRLELTVGKIDGSQNKSEGTQLFLDRFKRYQKVHGWGGSFTDSAVINIDRLSPKAQLKLMQSYFGEGGSRYNLARVPIAGSDFSVRGYTYDDSEGDVELKHFALQSEDLKYKIPAMRNAVKINPELKFVAAAWTAPPWMKTTKEYGSFGFLKGEFYQTYANYLLKFLDEYKKQGIEISSISTGNQPTIIPEYPLNLSSMSWSTSTMSKWIAKNLGPALAHSQHNKTEIYCFDDQRSFLPHHIQLMFKNEEVMNYVKAIGIHCYRDNTTSPTVLDQTHELFPDKPLWITEPCTGYIPADNPKVRLGSWKRAEYYISKMIENMNHWVSGWIDWNLALDKTGGPNWINNFVDAPIIVNPETDEFFKQPVYYSILHFSRFVPRGSIRLNITSTPQVPATAFITPEKDVVVVLCNLSDDPQNMSIDNYSGKEVFVTLSSRSFNTIVINADSFLLK